MALGCDISKFSVFDRKNYFYPDLPKAYQISQLYYPLCLEGKVAIDTPNGQKYIRINHIHLEEDAGKLVHDDFNAVSLADYNRCGIPLVEIVTEPDISSAEEAKAFIEKVMLLLQYAGVSDCKMEEGSLRCDVNVSIMRPEDKELGTRAEIKNMNSLKSITRAINYEIKRQSRLLDAGKKVVQETRRWDDNKESSHAMRSKEDAKDYRYFPDPDLPPIHISDAWIEELRESQPELREEKQLRYQSEYDLPAYDAGILTESRHLSMLFEEVAKLCGSPKKAANWFMGEVLRLTKDKALDVEKVSFTPEHLADLIQMVEKKEVSAQNAKKVFEKVFEEDIDPVSYIEEHGLKIVEDIGLLNDTLQKILDENPGPLEELLGGKEKVFGFFVGKMMRELKGKASPDAVREALVKEVEKRKNQ